MDMNNRGQLSAVIGIMIAVAIIVFALGIAPATKEAADYAMNETDITGNNGLNCTSSLLSDYDKGACVILDITTPTFIIALFAIGGIIITAKLILDNV